jgi:hypothetical protein
METKTQKQTRHLVFKVIRALQDKEIDQDEAVDLMRGGSALLVELQPHVVSWWAKRALDVASIALREQAETIENLKPDDTGKEDGRS